MNIIKLFNGIKLKFSCNFVSKFNDFIFIKLKKIINIKLEAYINKY